MEGKHVVPLLLGGLWLARRGLMSPSLSKGLSQLSVKLAIPALLFSSMVPGASFELLDYAWPLLLLPAVYLLVGMLVGVLVLITVFRIFFPLKGWTTCLPWRCL